MLLSMQAIKHCHLAKYTPTQACPQYTEPLAQKERLLQGFGLSTKWNVQTDIETEVDEG